MPSSRPSIASMLACAAFAPSLAGQGVERVNLDPAGQVVDGHAIGHITADGTLAYFGLSLGTSGIWVRDLALDATTALPLTGFLHGASATGQYVLYAQFGSFTFGTPPLTISRSYAHVHDRTTGNDHVLSSGAIATLPHAITDDGRYVAYHRHLPGFTLMPLELHLLDRQSGIDVMVDPANFPTLVLEPFFFPRPALSSDGRWLAFVSRNAALVPGDTNGQDDAFVYDRTTGAYERVSVGTGGVQGIGGGVPVGGALFGSWVSRVAQDRWVAFASTAPNLVPGDTNGAADVFLRDLQNDVTTRVSLTAAGNQSTNACAEVALSADARFVFFTAQDGDLVPGDTNGWLDVFVRDLVAGTTERLSLAVDGAQPLLPCSFTSIASDGTRVAVESFASNLVAGDTNGHRDVFVFESPPCTGSHAFCATTPNSTGAPGTIEWSGSTSLAANQLTLRAQQIPPSTLGIFLVSAQPQDPGTPFGNGLLCLTGTLRRLGVVQAAEGVASQTQNLAASAWAGILHGDRRWFQFYFRDVAAGGAFFNATNGLELVFCR